MILRNPALGRRIRTALPSHSFNDHTFDDDTQKHQNGTQNPRDAEYSTGTISGIVQSSDPLACR
jgi:hypothetical protein